MHVNIIGVQHLLRAAWRRGLLHTTNAAPAGALEANTEVMSPDDQGASPLGDPLASSMPNVEETHRLLRLGKVAGPG